MALIEWKDRMSVGVDALDNDHRKLIALLNQLHDLVRGLRTDVTAPQIVHELVKYTEYHFDCEERLMRLIRYPEYEEHVRIHRDLKRRIIAFEQKFLSNPTSDALLLPLFDFLSDWLMRHILREDMKLRPYMTRAQPAGSTRAGGEAVEKAAPQASPETTGSDGTVT